MLIRARARLSFAQSIAIALVRVLGAMFSRNAQPSSSSHARDDDVFVDDVNDLHAENLLSAQRALKLLRKACKAGVGVPKRLRQNKHDNNMARSQRTHALRRTKWPSYYWFPCRVLDRKTRKEHVVDLCMLLPQEIIHCLFRLGNSEVLLERDNLDSDSQAHLKAMCEKLGVDDALGFGIHGDGIPCNYDRTESVIMVSLNLPGLGGKNGRLRIPLIALPDWACSSNTYDDIFGVVAWQMRLMLARESPTCRHDRTEWNHTDKKRNGAKVHIPVPCVCVQIRGDWDWMGKCFHLPFHSVKGGCCWLCGVRRNEVSMGRMRTQVWASRVGSPSHVPRIACKC